VTPRKPDPAIVLIVVLTVEGVEAVPVVVAAADVVAAAGTTDAVGMVGRRDTKR
jgi:hypothetical protein